MVTDESVSAFVYTKFARLQTKPGDLNLRPPPPPERREYVYNHSIYECI